MKPRISMLILVVLALCAQAWRGGEMEIKMSNLTKAQIGRLSALRLSGDVWPGENGAQATMYVVAAQLTKLDMAGIPYRVTIADMNAYYKDFWSNQAGRRHSLSYHSYDQIIALMDSLVRVYPSICVKIALSTSVQNRQLCMLKISKNVSRHENESQICFDGGIHGDEVGGPENLILLARDLCTKYGNDPIITNLVDSREIFIYCMVNPDGRAALTRENADAVDCNRNVGYMWASGGGSAPFSEPETKAMRTAVLSNQFVIQISYHSGTEEILYPWCYTGDTTPDKAHHVLLTNLYASTSGYGASLRNLQSYADYPTNGETIDFNYGTMGAAGLTFEISSDKQPTDISGYYEKNYPAMIKMIEYAGYGIEGTVVDSIDNKPISAKLSCGSSFPFYTDPALGDYHKFVKAGTYSLTITANGYVPKTIAITAQDGKSTVASVKLQRDAQSKKCYAYKVVCVDDSTTATFSALGPADNKPSVLRGRFGMVVDMQFPIADSVGKEIVVRIFGTTSTYTCSAGQSPDGPWKVLGTSTLTDSFDLAQGALKTAQYIKIQGSNCGLDAIEGAWSYNSQAGIFQRPSPSVFRSGLTITPCNDGLLLRMKEVWGSPSIFIVDVRGKTCFASKIGNSGCIWRPRAKGFYILGIIRGNKKIVCDRYLVR